MLIDGINLVEGSTIVNLTVASGTAYPSSPSTGELFYRTDLDKLYVYSGIAWDLTGADPETAPANEIVMGTGTGLTSNANFTYDATTGSLLLPERQVTGTPMNITLTGASPTGTGAGAGVDIVGGNGDTNGNGGHVYIPAGYAGNTAGNTGGYVAIEGGSGGNTGNNGNGGYVSILGGGAGTSAGTAGHVTIAGGTSEVGVAGNVTIDSGGTTSGTIGQLIFMTGGNPSASVTDNGTNGIWTFAVNPYITSPESTSSNQLAHFDYVDTQDTFRVALAGDSMDSAANLTFSGGGEIIGLPATPSVSTAAASKAYVDNLVSGSTTWRDPIECPNLQNIVSAIPTPVDRGSYVKFGGTQNETWGAVTNVVNNDILEYRTATGWARLGTLAAGTRFIVAGEVGTAGAGAITAEMRTMDLVEYVSGNANLAASWSKPNLGNVQGVMFGSTTKTGGSATGLTNDATIYYAFVKVNGSNYGISVTGNGAQTFTNLMSEINSDISAYATASIVDGHIHITGNNATDTILISDGGAPNLWTALTDYSEIRSTVTSGTTVLAHNPGCAEYGQTFLYSLSNHDWIKISGPGSIQAGVGLVYDGNILNITLGAGIQELPTDEVGIDIYPSSGLMTTTDGTNSATTTNAQLSLTKTGVSASTYKSVTVDAYGRITAGTNPTTVDGFGITDAAEINPGSPKDGDVRVTGSVVDIYASGAWRQVFPAVYS